MLSAATQVKGTSAAITRLIIACASWGLVAKVTLSGTCAAALRAGASLQVLGK
jgi:hypothetical protein